MNLSKYARIVSCLAAGGLLLVGLFLLLNETPQVARADPGDLFVKPDGSGTACSQASPCALQTALAQASDGDTIYVAGGTYTGTGAAVITVTKSITLYGGWDGAASGPVVRDPAAYPTLLDGEGARRVIYISGDITPTLNGFIIARGNGTGLVADCYGTAGNPDGCGGGLFVSGAHPLIVNNVITNNVAAITTAGYPTSTTGYGGGMYLHDADRAVISGNVIISNVASTAYKGMGGGICLLGTGSGLVVQANQVLSNVAAKSTGWGGGIAGGPNGALIQENLVEGNRTSAAGGGYGAGLYQWSGSAEYRDNIVRGNAGGSAVYLGYSRSRFEGNRVVDNATRVGVYLTNGPGPTLVNNVVARSASYLYSVSAYAYAGAPLNATLLHNTLVGGGSGSGVYIETGYVTLSLTNTIIVSHVWGITNTVPASSAVFADHTLFWGNTQNGITGTRPIFADPRLAADGYHLGPGSAAIDAGVDAGVTADIDGDPRPIGAGYDIGADEIGQGYIIYLPLVKKNYP